MRDTIGGRGAWRVLVTAEHDLGLWLDRCLQRGLPVGAPSIRTFEITDRLGNGVCAAALYPVGHAGAGFTS